MAPPLDSSRDKEPFRGRWKFVINTVAKTEGTACDHFQLHKACSLQNAPSYSFGNAQNPCQR